MIRNVEMNLLFIVLLIPFIGGCASNYCIIKTLNQPVTKLSTCIIGDFINEIPDSLENIYMPDSKYQKIFIEAIKSEITDQELFEITDDRNKAEYKIVITILEFSYDDKPAFQSLIFGWKSTYLLVSIELIHLSNDKSIFVGNFRSDCKTVWKRRDKIFTEIAIDFCESFRIQNQKFRFYNK